MAVNLICLHCIFCVMTLVCLGHPRTKNDHKEVHEMGTFLPVFIPIASVSLVIANITLLYAYLYLKEKGRVPEIPDSDEPLNGKDHHGEPRDIDIMDNDRVSSQMSDVSRQIQDVEPRAMEFRQNHTGLPNASTA